MCPSSRPRSRSRSRLPLPRSSRLQEPNAGTIVEGCLRRFALNLTAFVAVALIGLAFRLFARSRSYVRIDHDGVHVRNYPRKETVLSLDEVNRFQGDASSSGRTTAVSLLRYAKGTRPGHTPPQLA
jgi:hypothetical protein